MNKRLTSRKFWLTQEIVLLGVGLPLAFQYAGISEGVTLMALGIVSGAGTLYGVISTFDKKLNGGDN